MEEEKKQFACNECNKRFARKGTLKTHSLIHSGEKPYKCNWCEKSFRQPANLNFHVSRYHQEFAPPEKKTKKEKTRENESSSKTSPHDGIPSAKKPRNIDFEMPGRMEQNGYGSLSFDSSRESEEFRDDTCGFILRDLPNGHTIDDRKNVQNDEFQHANTKSTTSISIPISSSDLGIPTTLSRNMLMNPVDNFPVNNMQFDLNLHHNWTHYPLPLSNIPFYRRF